MIRSGTQFFCAEKKDRQQALGQPTPHPSLVVHLRLRSSRPTAPTRYREACSPGSTPACLRRELFLPASRSSRVSQADRRVFFFEERGTIRGLGCARNARTIFFTDGVPSFRLPFSGSMFFACCFFSLPFTSGKVEQAREAEGEAVQKGNRGGLAPGDGQHSWARELARSCRDDRPAAPVLEDGVDAAITR